MNAEAPHQAQALALAALYQALAQVRMVATTGRWDADDAETCLRGLTVEFQESLDGLYGGTGRLRTGLQQLHTQLSQPQDMDLTRYAVMALHLERKLVKRRDMLSTLRTGLDQARHQADYFSITHENVVGKLADLYQNTVSHLTPRIMVQGKREWLEDPQRANQIRALLLAAIRAATLWRQAGGGRLQLIFGRARLQSTTNQLLDGATT